MLAETPDLPELTESLGTGRRGLKVPDTFSSSCCTGFARPEGRGLIWAHPRDQCVVRKPHAHSQIMNRIHKVEIIRTDSERWFRQVSNWIALAALLISFGTTSITIHFQFFSKQDRLLISVPYGNSNTEGLVLEVVASNQGDYPVFVKATELMLISYELSSGQSSYYPSEKEYSLKPGQVVVFNIVIPRESLLRFLDQENAEDFAKVHAEVIMRFNVASHNGDIKSISYEPGKLYVGRQNSMAYGFSPYSNHKAVLDFEGEATTINNIDIEDWERREVFQYNE